MSKNGKWTPSINNTSEIIGIVLLFIPYMIILLPFLQNKIISFLQALYLHKTPRNEWNNAIDQQPPRRIVGYILSILFSFFAVALLLINNHRNNYWLDFFQYFVYLSLPLIIAIIRPPSNRPCDFFDILIILFIIIPVELSQRYDRFLPDITFKIYDSWNQSPNISILRVTGFNLFLFIFFIFRPLNNIGLNWYIPNIHWIFLKFLCILSIFLIFAVPFCLIPSVHYLHSPKAFGNVWIDGFFRFFCLFFFNSLLSEFLYRGVLQNLFHSALDFRVEAQSYLKGNYRELADLSSRPIEEQSDGQFIVYKEEDTLSDKVSIEYAKFDRNTCSKCLFLRLEYARDWMVIFVASMIYSVTNINYKRYESELDIIYGIILLFWLGFCCGWLYKISNSCFVSAIFNALIVFSFKFVFNADNKFCNGACL